VTSRNRRQFTPEFKAEAVALVEAAGGNIAQVAKELKIYDSTLGNWGAPRTQKEVRSCR
jgi:transposase